MRCVWRARAACRATAVRVRARTRARAHTHAPHAARRATAMCRHHSGACCALVAMAPGWCTPPMVLYRRRWQVSCMFNHQLYGDSPQHMWDSHANTMSRDSHAPARATMHLQLHHHGDVASIVRDRWCVHGCVSVVGCHTWVSVCACTHTRVCATHGGVQAPWWHNVF